MVSHLFVANTWVECDNVGFFMNTWWYQIFALYLGLLWYAQWSYHDSFCNPYNWSDNLLMESACFFKLINAAQCTCQFRLQNSYFKLLHYTKIWEATSGRERRRKQKTVVTCKDLILKTEFIVTTLFPI
jgi:hypothetical protein